MIARLRRWLAEPEVIGPDECPLILRWTLGGDELVKDWPVKVMVHRFLPFAADRDPHDHPRPFVTAVLRGVYVDERHPDEYREVMRAGMVRLRLATHAHTTRTGAEGAWTLVVMGPPVRPWGFFRDGRWIAFQEYVERFGHGMRCP